MSTKFLREKTPNWDMIDKIGKVKILKFSFIIFFLLPIAAQLIDKYKLEIEIPFSWILLYYSTLLISISTILYNVFCPDLIKRFDNFESFEKSGRTGKYLKQQFGVFTNKKIKSESEISLYLAKKYSFVNTLNVEEIEQKIKRCSFANDTHSFWFAYELLDYSRLRYRFLCSVMYLIGFLLFIIVVGEKIYYVTKYFFSS